MLMRQILTINLAALLLLSNVGIPVFTHICHTQEKSWSSVYVPAKACCSKKKNKSFIACHSPVQDDNTVIKGRPCCEDHNELCQLNVDFLRSHSGIDISMKYSPLPNIFILEGVHIIDIKNLAVNTNQPHGPPLALHGRSLLISQQVFRC